MVTGGIAFVRTGSGITAYPGNNRVVNIPGNHPKMDEIKEALVAGDADRLVSLTDTVTPVKNFTKGKCEVRGGVVYYNNEPQHGVIVDYIVRCMNEGFPFAPALAFMDNIMLNPSFRSRNELFTFLLRHNLVLTPDGCFLAYKRVRSDWMDIYTGKISNHIGAKPSMPRPEVNDDCTVDCSDGLHVGAMSYVSTYHSGGHIVICKVNPRDVVSVPKDADCTKVRCCDYEVVAEYTGDLVFPVYNNDATPYDPQVPPLMDNDGFDDDDDDEDSDLDDGDYDSETEEAMNTVDDNDNGTSQW